MKKKYNYSIGFIRIIFCLAVLFYHLGLLKGGYLAVCSFFVLTGYFQARSIYKPESLKKYYLKRLKKIYLPLLIVVASTVGILTLTNLASFNLKTETLSILLGYNNYWQLSANADYFAKHINSPFMHLWYIAILLQIELIMPIILRFLKNTGKKIGKFIPCFIAFLLLVISTIYFYHNSLIKNLMFTYYDTFSRLFSYLLGIFISLIHINYRKMLLPFKNLVINYIIYFIYIISLCIMFFTIDASNKYFAIAMILTTFITGRLITYSSFIGAKKEYENKLIKLLSDISYEIYLIQYPVIFLYSKLKFNNILKIVSIVLITIILSALLHFILNISKKAKLKALRIILLIPVISFTLFGIFKFIIMKDYTKEMNYLKDTLSNNEEIMKKKQEEYLKKQEQEEQKLDDYIKSLELNEDELHEKVKNLRIVGIGDSILLDAIDTLYKEFPNGYFDGKISRTTCAGADVLGEIKNKGITWDVLVFSLGTNGYPSDKCKDKIMQYVSDETPVFWLNATHADYDTNNAELEKYVKNHQNIHILDWESVIKEHPEYLYKDYIHLRPGGFKPYAEFIEQGIFNYYLENYNAEKEKSINEYKKKQPEKINFYGNELLINSYSLIQNDFEESKFEADKDFNYNKLLELLKNDSKLPNKLVFVFDNQAKININDYKKIIEVFNEHTFYIVSLNSLKLEGDNINIIELNLDEDDYLSDKIHLSKKGNKKLKEKIIEVLKSGE